MNQHLRDTRHSLSPTSWQPLSLAKSPSSTWTPGGTRSKRRYAQPKRLGKRMKWKQCSTTLPRSFASNNQANEVINQEIWPDRAIQGPWDKLRWMWPQVHVPNRHSQNQIRFLLERRTQYRLPLVKPWRQSPTLFWKPKPDLHERMDIPWARDDDAQNLQHPANLETGRQYIPEAGTEDPHMGRALRLPRGGQPRSWWPPQASTRKHSQVCLAWNAPNSFGPR